MPRGSTKQEMASQGSGHKVGFIFFFYEACIKVVVGGFGTAGFVMMVVLVLALEGIWVLMINS